MSSIKLFFIRILKLFLPETRAFKLKRILYRFVGIKIGHEVRICSSADFIGSGIVEIGAGAWIGHQTTIISTSSVKIGRNVDIAPRVYIGTGTHEVDPAGSRVAGKGVSKPVIIGDGCWIGAGAMIMPGITIGNMAIVAAGSVVTKNVDERTVVAGVPAKLIKEID